MRYANVALEGYSILICLVLLVYQAVHKSSYKRQKYWFIILLLANIGTAAGDMADWLCSGDTSEWAVFYMRYGTLLLFVCAGLLALGLTGYLAEFMELRSGRSRAIRAAAGALCLIQAVCSFLSLKNGMFFYFEEGNIYHRGHLYLISQAIPSALYILDVLLIVEGREKLYPRSALFLSSFIFLPLLGQMIQVKYYGVTTITPAVTLAILLSVINVQREQELAAKEREKELTEMRVEIMLSQIRPHFLYNVLTAIRQMCDTNPAEAKESILDFSRFLRANMNSLTTKEPIPFTRELEHTKSYLNLEKRRFGDRIRVLYDTPVTDFKIPTLTLQPIVENAVRHGILRKEEGGTICIRTQPQDDGVLVIVDDDGVGISSPAGGGSGAHIGLSNVKSRIESQCGGSLLVQSDDNGTAVAIWIPREIEKI